MEDEGGRRYTEEWIKKKHFILYKASTRHPFILSLRHGSLDTSSFKTWLGQDYVFVREFVAYVASVLIKASKASEDKNYDTEVLLCGMASLKDEIHWFKHEASKWDVSLSDIIIRKPTQNYCSFLESLMLPEVEYGVAITALWAIETVYQESFAHCLEEGNQTPPDLKETCQRWGNKEFGEYCCTLGKITNRVLLESRDDVIAKAEATFLRVLEHEIEFWNMANVGTV